MSRRAWDWIDAELRQLDELGLLRRRGLRTGGQGPEILWGGRTVLNFGSNDYLGLARRRVATLPQDSPIEPAESPATTSRGAGASPLVTGRGVWHERLEHALADFEQTESAMLFPTGFAANVGTIATLVGRGDILFSDSKNHASIIDGSRLSGARIQVYPHARADYLEKYLAQSTGFRRRLIVTDGLFSMDGDLAPLDALADLADRYDAMLVVDEAHATGVFGDAGRGACEHFGIEDRVTAKVGTLSKALGTLGGFVVGPRTVIEWLVNRARPYVFSTASPESLAADALDSLRIVREEPARRRELLARAADLRRRLTAQGWQVGDSVSQIIPLVVGSPDRTMEFARRLLDLDLFVPGIRPPTVPDGESLLRISLVHGHTAEMLERLVAGLATVIGSVR